jgi:hypothetical protein
MLCLRDPWRAASRAAAASASRARFRQIRASIRSASSIRPQLERHLNDFVNAYNFGRRLKTLKGLTPYEFICKTWTSQPERFILNPLQQMPGLNT